MPLRMEHRIVLLVAHDVADFAETDDDPTMDWAEAGTAHSNSAISIPLMIFIIAPGS